MLLETFRAFVAELARNFALDPGTKIPDRRVY